MPNGVKTISVPTVGIKDVARLAGVSPATVSRALGGGPISEALRKQVEDAVKASGYRPNLAARRLRSQQSGTIGLIVADICNPFFTAVSRAVEAAAWKRGLRVIFCNTDEDPEREADVLSHMAEERLAGLILAPTRGTHTATAPIAVDCPVVLIDRVAPGNRHDAVTLDNRVAVDLLVDHIVAQGYRRIGGLFGSTSSTGVERRDAFVAALRRHGLEGEVREMTPQTPTGHAAAADWLGRADRPDALIASNGLLLMGIVKAAQEAGLRMPEQLAIAGFDDEPWTQLVEPGITVVAQPTDDIGRSAMGLLAERIDHPDQPQRRIVLAPRLIARGSTAARTAS